MCIAIEYAEVPSAATSRAAERRGSRGIRRKMATAAPTAAVPCTKSRLDNSDLAGPGWLFTAWS